MGSTVIAGRPSNTVGDKDSTLVLRGSSIKIQQGNKFIDLLKNGKINVEIPEQNIIKISNQSEISKNGIYILQQNDTSQLLVFIDGEIIDFNNSKQSCISYSEEQELTTEEQQVAQSNLGIVFDTLEEAKNQNITDGFIFDKQTGSFYIVKEKVFTPYIIQSENKQEEDPLKELFINTLHIYNNGTDVIDSISNSLVLSLETQKYLQLSNNSIFLFQYPKYDTSLMIPNQVGSQEYDQFVPNLGWVKQLLVPSGTIVMWSGNEIPQGWVICDGNNGTPNLIGKFIKASDIAGNTGGNNSITLKIDNLPDHQHGISEMSTLAAGKNVHSHTIPEQNITSSNTSVSDSSIIWKTVPEDTENLSNITTTKGQPLLNLVSGDNYLDTNVITTEYNHSINIEEQITSLETIEAHTHSIEAHNTSSTIDANNTEINIEPEYYSLIFIMKL